MGKGAGSADERLVRRTALRVGLQTAAAVAVTVVVLCVVAILVLLRSQHSAQTNLVDAAIARADDVNDPPAGVWLVVERAGQRAASPGIPAGFPEETALRDTAADGVNRAADVTVGGTEYLVRTEPHGDSVVQAILDLRSAHVERDRLLRALLISGAAGLILAGLAGAWLARRAVLPLLEALAVQRRFVADASHELRTPLTLLSTRAQLLRRQLKQGADPGSTESDVDGLVNDAAVLTTILEDLLLAADPREDVPRQPVNLRKLVNQVVDAAQPSAQEREVRVSVESDDRPILLHGYESGLRRAVTALLDNGIRHARTAVRIVVRVADGQVRVDVEDDGPGIDPAILPTIFNRFASNSGDGAVNGRRRYGLGLALVSEIAARHGGTVTAHTTGDTGATLRLLLPMNGS
jgi:two-component system OmpR family sensor kinase